MALTFGIDTLSQASRQGADDIRTDVSLGDFLDAFSQPVYITDTAGKLSYYNAAAATLWNARPALGETAFLSSWQLYTPDGRPLSYDEGPMVAALRNRRASETAEIVATEPDGIRRGFLVFSTLLYGPTHQLRGVLHLLVRQAAGRVTAEVEQQLAAIVSSSDDAILTKDLNGVITSWNAGAQRLFGYTADEVIGKPVTILIPLDRHDEEPGILARIRRGDRVDHYETIRRRKDGSLIEISLTVSPVRNRHGVIVGASKIARDITERKRAEERQRLLLQEMNHRLKNLFTLSMGVVTLSQPFAASAADLAATVRDRLSALAQAHSLTLSSDPLNAGAVEKTTTLRKLIRTIVLPYDHHQDGESRINITGIDIPIAGPAVTSFALLLHEFATNAAKYGALSVPEGRIDIDCETAADRFVIIWTERGGPPPVDALERNEGFGSRLAKLTVAGQFGGEIDREWRPDGLTIRLSVLQSRVTP